MADIFRSKRVQIAIASILVLVANRLGIDLQQEEVIGFVGVVIALIISFGATGFGKERPQLSGVELADAIAQALAKLGAAGGVRVEASIPPPMGDAPAPATAEGLRELARREPRP